MWEIVDLFKTPVYGDFLKLNNSEIASYFYKLKKKSKARNRSNLGGWQSEDLKRHLIIENLCEAIESHSNRYAQKIGLKPLQLSNLWFNINNYKDTNIIHNHPNAILSGVYYVKVPKNGGDICFLHPCYDVFAHDWNDDMITNLNKHTSARWIIKSVDSKLLIFPTWLNHYVQPNLNKKEERISVSFNLVLKGSHRASEFYDKS